MRNGAEAKRPYVETQANALTGSTKTGRGTGHKGLGGPILGNARAPKGLYFAAWGCLCWDTGGALFRAGFGGSNNQIRETMTFFFRPLQRETGSYLRDIRDLLNKTHRKQRRLRGRRCARRSPRIRSDRHRRSCRRLMRTLRWVRDGLVTGR